MTTSRAKCADAAAAHGATLGVEGTLSASLEQVVKVTIYLTDMGNFPKIVALRERWFSAPYPADTIVEVTSLALPELEIEIEAMAVIDGETVAAP